MTTSDTQRIRTLFDQRVPMRDGITLSADIYLPVGETAETAKWPTVLLRTPYLKADVHILERAHYFTGQGYVYVALDVRGRGDSDGQFVPYVNDGQDGYDTIEWLAVQPWSNGNIGTEGSSYPGCIQWLTTLHQPPHLRAMVVRVTPSDPFVETPTGLPPQMHLCWLHFVSGRTNQLMEAVDWSEVYMHLPLLTMDERAGRYNKHWRADIEHAQLDEFWQPLCYQDKFERVGVPILHISRLV